MTTDALRPCVLFLLLSVTAPLHGCRAPAAERPREGSEPARVRLGQEFNLRAGQRAAVEGEGFGVRFVSVENDSRCPVDATCVWQGNAEVLIEAEAGGSPAVLKLNTHGGDKFPKEGRHRQYSVGLVALAPQPRREQGIKAADYVATLLIRKE